jgi:signal transduction histidine kinase
VHVDSNAEGHRLRAVLRDVVALSGIPAAWIGSDPSVVAAGLADTLMELLQLDFAFVRLSDPGGAETVEVTRGNAWTGFPEWLQGHLAANAPLPRKEIVPDVGDSERRRGFAVSVGVNGQGGVVAAASERSDFPTPMDELLLSLAANHAAAAFQSARLVQERKRGEEELRKARNELEVNVAERTEELQVANDELSALHRVATLVAKGAQRAEIFTAVSDEVRRLFDSDASLVVRFDHDDPAIVFDGVSTNIEGAVPVETRWDVDNASTAEMGVFRTGCCVRVDQRDWRSLDGPAAEAGHRLGIVSTVASPIVVDGRPWGAISVSSAEELLPPDTEERLVKFTELLATAIANAESSEALARLAEEQAALRRVATLVARGVRPAEVFSAVSEEVGHLFGSGAAVVRFDDDGRALVFVGVSKSERGTIPVGTRWDITDDRLASARVCRTGRSARMNARDWSSLGGAPEAAGRRLGLVSTVAAPIIVEGRSWGAMSASSSDSLLPHDTEERLEKFTELVATAIANAEGKSELAASRRRIVAASDEARRRIERDLHDGTQQRLVTLMLQLAAVREAAPTGEVLIAELSRIHGELASALDELREMSRGIHPSILSDGGLGPALRALARRSTIPVTLDVTMERRLAEPLEAAAYFVASEALANATKHAQASRIEFSLVPRSDGGLLLSIRDDGVGGADPGQGSGLVGLHDRVEALGGTIAIESPPGAGTLVVVALPLEVQPTRIGVGSTTE